MQVLHIPPPFLAADWSRVYLRQLCKDDALQLFGWINSNDVTRHLSVVLPISLSSEEAWLESVISDYNPKNGMPTKLVLGICLADSDELIGTMNLSNIDWVHRHATTGALIGNKEHRSKNYGREAKHLLLRHAFRRLGMRKIHSGAKEPNERSLRYMAANGYREIGRYRDHYLVDGKYVDLVITEVFRDDWEKAFEQFLERK